MQRTQIAAPFSTYIRKVAFIIAVAAAATTAACSTEPPPPPPPGDTKPAAPTAVGAMCGNQKITLSWAAVTGAVTYNVNRSTTTGGTATLAGSTAALTYVDATGAVGSQYFYTITAVNAAGTSVASTEVSETVCRLMGGTLQAKVLTFTLANATVSTFAGTSGFSGFVDGTGATARFSLPQGMTTDGTFLYVADFVNNAIRKIDPTSGAVTVFAGSATGVSGSTDGTGTAARFFRPYDITSDGTNLFVTDNSNCTVRRIVIASAAVTTLAGTVATNCGTPLDGIGTAARFDHPNGITTDGTNLYITENVAVRRVVIATGAVTTFAGSTNETVGHVDGVGTAARFNNLEGITTDGTNLYVVDMGQDDIRKIVIATATVSTMAGDYTAIAQAGSVDGTGTAAKFNRPIGITTDGTNLFVVEQWGNVVRKIAISTAATTTLAGKAEANGNLAATGTTDGIGAAAKFSAPQGITLYCGSLYIGDSSNGSIRRIK